MSHKISVPLMILKIESLVALKKFKEADRAYEEADRQNTHLKELHDELANQVKEIKFKLLTKALDVYLRKGLELGKSLGEKHFKKARKCVRRALDIYPDNVELLDKLYTIYQYLGQTEEAFKVKARIYTLNSKFITAFDKESNTSLCFLATFAYDNNPAKLDIFRWFRREFLLTSKLGQKINSSYVKFSPKLLEKIQYNKYAKPIFLLLLEPLRLFFILIKKNGNNFMKKINNFFIKALLIVFAVLGAHVISPAIAITDKSNLKVGLYNDEDITTVRIQSFSGNWKAYFYPKKVEGAKAKPPQKEILIEGEDLAILLVKKGIIGRLSTGKDIEKGYERVVIKGGELMNIEIPNQPPLLLVGELEVLLDDPTLVLINQITIHQHLVSSVSKIGISTEPEALKAFIVMARTRLNFLLQNSVHKDEPYDLCDKSHCLPFQGAGANRELVDILINKVKDLTMTYKNKLFLPRYQNSCGGKISSAGSVYGFNEPYHVSKIDRQEKKGSENCFHSPKFHWSIELTKQEILEFLADSFAGGANRILYRLGTRKS